MRFAVMIRKVHKLSVLTRKMLRYSNPNKLLGRMVVVFTLLATAYPGEEGAHVHDQDSIITNAENVHVANTVCPVMPDMKADPAIFTDYEGKRVYFCCRNCKAAFAKNPEKYLPRLPQFGGSVAHVGQNYEDHSFELTLAGFVKPVGIITLSLLVLTIAVALLRRRKPKLLLKWHKRLGITTLVFAAIHAILVLIAH